MLLYIVVLSLRSSYCRVARLTTELRSRVLFVTPSHPADDGQLDDENGERRPHHRTECRRHNLRLDVDGIPGCETSPVATIARKPVPDRERDRQKLSRHERGAGAGAK